MDPKKIAAEKAVEKIKDGMVVGLGTGSTAAHAIRRIGERVSQGLVVKAVATSDVSEKLARSLNIPVFAPQEIEFVDIAIDGADQVDKNGNLIKGGGGALLREKIIAYASKRFYVIIDESKQTDTLGRFPLPVEIVPFAANLTMKHLSALGCTPSLRKVNHTVPYLTDNGNLVVDCLFISIPDPAFLDGRIKAIPGVVETGLFLKSMVTAIVTGYRSGEVSEYDQR